MKFFNFNHALLCVLLVSNIGCSLNNCEYATETRHFNAYLEEELNSSIPDTPTCFVVFPANSGCGGCKSTLIQFRLNHALIPHVRYILPEEYASYSTLSMSSDILLDHSNNIERINAKTQQLVLIETQSRQIVRITHIVPQNIEQILQQLQSGGDAIAYAESGLK